jgi:hypothetical protein
MFSPFRAPHCALCAFGCGFLFGLRFFSFVVPLSSVFPLFIYLFRILELCLGWVLKNNYYIFHFFPLFFPFFLFPYYLTPPTYHPSPFLLTYTPKSYHPIFLCVLPSLQNFIVTIYLFSFSFTSFFFGLWCCWYTK